MQEITECGISGAKDFHLLWNLPGLPLTERFGPYDPNHKLAFDQELLISLPTGHVQLRNQVDPKILYNNTEYSFRTGGSNKSRRDVNFFHSYLQRFTSGRSFNSVVDVGGGTSVTAGKFLSYLGYEAFDIPNMTQVSYANGDFLGAIPGYHTGVRVDLCVHAGKRQTTQFERTLRTGPLRKGRDHRRNRDRPDAE